MTARREWFVNLKNLKTEIPVRIGNGKYISATGKGDINILAFDGRTWNEKHLSNVLYVPQLKYNLFSAGAALEKELQLHSDNGMCQLKKNGETILMGERQGKLYHMKIKNIPVEKNSEAHVTICTFQEWHEHMAC